MVLVQESHDREEHMFYYISKSLPDLEIRYCHVEKLALATFFVVQRFCHYILLQKTMIIVDANPMYHILTQEVLGGKYSHWIVILQEFYLEFGKSKSKKNLVFAELICDLPQTDQEEEHIALFTDGTIFLISTSDPWYGDILSYLQTQHFRPELSCEDRCRIRHHVKHCLIVDDTLYRHGPDTILERCLTHDEAASVLNGYQSRACGGHLSGMATV